MSPGPDGVAGEARRGHLGAALSGAGAAVVAALLGLTVAGRTVRAPPAALAVAVTFLPYLFLVAGAALAVAWIAAPRRRAIPLGLAALAVAGFGLWGPSLAARPADGVPLRIMSWNLRRLWGGPGDDGDAGGCAARAIEAADPDVLTLLEVSALDVSALSRRLGLSCAHHPYTSGGAPKHGGLATCTRGDRWRFVTGEGERFVDDEDWYYVLAETEGAGRRVNVLAVHLYPYEYVARKLERGVDTLAHGDPTELAALANHGEEIVKGQADQSAALLERVSKLKDPTVLAGDFNSTRDAFLHAALRRRGLTDAFDAGGKGFGGTVSLFGLPLRVDYVYASPELAVAGASVGAEGCSDHRPVIADLRLRE